MSSVTAGGASIAIGGTPSAPTVAVAPNGITSQNIAVPLQLTSSVGLPGSTLRGINTGNGSGIQGNSTTGVGVTGISTSSTGVSGSSQTGVGVFGWRSGTTGTNAGVFGLSSSPQGAGVRASGSGAAGTALEISQGGIKVTGAGVGTDTAAFVVHAPIFSGSTFYFHNSLTDGDGNAVLIVTPRRGDPIFGSAPKPVYVVFNPITSQWGLVTMDGTFFDPSMLYNVLVIKR